MTSPGRVFIGLILLAAILAGGAWLLQRGSYGWTLFVAVPFLLGVLAAWVLQPPKASTAALYGAEASLFAALSLLAVGAEGGICLLMALPLVTPLGAFGGWLTYQAREQNAATGSLAMILLLPSASLTWDAAVKPPVFEVRSAIEVAATPERVWKHVITFSDLPEPTEWFFRAGVAYPQRARIVGSGVGAIRYCEFSTGPFVEPIRVWDEPRLLRFGVTANPAPLQEWSPYGQISPKHLHGYLISKQGQFELTPLPNGHTLLAGTTWYQHGFWPAQYWRWWSDAIIHRIHLRVLNHIKTLAEGS
ncbi:MAG TPA: hypothetical protein VMT86_00990 [Bryobacteraceae bacterium]|nr:hypothetical protein [Bryobacteraceae bacterium]